MTSSNKKQHGGEAGSAKLKKQLKGAGYGFTGKEGVLGRGTYSARKYMIVVHQKLPLATIK